MSFLGFFILSLSLLSASTSFVLRNTVTDNFGHVKAYGNALVIILQVVSFLFVPLLILFSSFSWWQAIIFYVLSVILAKHLSKIIAGVLIRQKHGHLIVLVAMGLSAISWLTLPKKTYADGYYCAKVHYQNPNTEKESDYTLTVRIENNKVVELQFPKGGWLDESHYVAPEINSRGKAYIIDDRDYEYTVSNLNDGECDEIE